MLFFRYFSISLNQITLNPSGIFTYKISQVANFQIFLNHIYTLIKDFIPAFSYGKIWTICETETKNEILKKENQLNNSLEDIGIISGKLYETIRL